MNQTFFEIYSEEIPARMQLDAQNQLKKLLFKKLKEKHIFYEDISTHVTPQRLVGFISNISNQNEEQIEYIRGPKSTVNPIIHEKFKQSHNDSEIFQKDGYLFAKKIQPNQKISDLLPQIIEEIIVEFSWPKSMYWPQTIIKWVRPIRRLFCMYNDQILNFEIFNMKSSKTVIGHRFISPVELIPKNFDDYCKQLEKHYVILSYEKRMNIIKETLKKESNSIIDEDLIQENAGLCEYPNIIFGKIDKKFMDLPDIVLNTSMKKHQKYFAFQNNQPNFAVVTNIIPKDTTSMLNGYERVLRARLSDASFFFKTDQKEKLETFVEKLYNITFQSGLGSMGDKTKRLISLMHTEKQKRAALLCKADLVTLMVREFPELQGKMGEIYALIQGEDKEVSGAIYEHYLPIGPNTPCPQTETGAYLSLVDKIDTLVGLIGTGTAKISGSKDPLGLRRTALGIIRLYYESKTTYNLESLIDASIHSYEMQNIKIEHKEKLWDFLKTRLFIFLKEQTYNDEIINACISLDLKNIFNKVATLKKFLETTEGRNFIESYKRVIGFLKDNSQITIADQSFEHKTEQLLMKLILDPDPLDFNKIKVVSEPLNQYFDEVTILKGENLIIQKRIALLNKFSEKIECFIKFRHLINFYG